MRGVIADAFLFNLVGHTLGMKAEQLWARPRVLLSSCLGPTLVGLTSLL